VGPLAFAVIVVVIWGGVALAAGRFARKREREGLWNEHGPIHPTTPPADFLRLPGYVALRPTIESDDTESDDDPNIP
jgi:hypothetical protein